MLGDREYMRTNDYRSPMTLTAKLAIAMVVIFVLQSIDRTYLRSGAEGTRVAQPVVEQPIAERPAVRNSRPDIPRVEPAGISKWLALTREGLRKGWLWQLITFQFLHGSLLHLGFNLLVFWWCGNFCERVLGRNRFLIALLGCGALGGMAQGVLMFYDPYKFGFVTVGASAGISGLLAIFSMLQRDQEVHLYMLIPIRAIMLLYGLIALSVFCIVFPPGDGVAYASHLGGLLAGVAWVKLGWHQDYVRLPWERWSQAWKERRSRRPVRLPKPSTVLASAISKSVAASKGSGSSTTASAVGPTEFISREVDPILDKIAAHGIHSLTDEEKRVLENARARMEKR